MTKALVIGANGQDGTFLVRHLLAKNYHVAGIGRQFRSRWDIGSPLYTYHQVDLNKVEELSRILELLKPDLVFHVAAVHTSAGGVYETIYDSVLRVNVASVHAILEHLRKEGHGRLCYASSAKVYGSPLPALIDERSTIKNQCLYSISKNTAYHLIEFYRKTHAVSASVVYLFNHESELRPRDYFIPKLVEALALALKDRRHVSEINTLDFYCDWGSADEYMSIMVEIIERGGNEDFHLARGEAIYARELARKLFACFGLNHEMHVAERSPVLKIRQAQYRVDLSRLNERICRIPHVDIESVCLEILRKNYCQPD